LPITALRETPIAAAIWLQVMPLPTQLRSCSMRSAVQVAFEAGMRCGAGAIAAESGSAGATDAIAAGGIADDETDGTIDGDIDGDIETASRYCRGRSGPPTGRLSARSGQPRDASLEAKIDARLEEPIRKKMPQT
jgi:hypothetical protein